MGRSIPAPARHPSPVTRHPSPNLSSCPRVRPPIASVAAENNNRSFAVAFTRMALAHRICRQGQEFSMCLHVRIRIAQLKQSAGQPGVVCTVRPAFARIRKTTDIGMSHIPSVRNPKFLQLGILRDLFRRPFYVPEITRTQASTYKYEY